MPVIGWTLPGVMTVGGLQTLARSYRVGARSTHRHRRQWSALPADRGRADRRRRQCRGRSSSSATAARSLRHGPSCAWPPWSDPVLTAKGLALTRRLKRHPALAPAGDAPPGARIVCDGWRAGGLANRRRYRGAWAMAFASSSGTGALRLGCSHRFVARGHWGSMETVTDGEGAATSNRRGLRRSGDGARFGGAHIAQAQGVLAAGAIARDPLRFAGGSRHTRAPRSARSGARRTLSQSALWAPVRWERRSCHGPSTMPPSVCRCEELNAGELRARHPRGATTRRRR